MRLYKYLLITDDVINNPNIFKETIFTEKYKHHIKKDGEEKDHEVVVEYKNRFYTYVKDENITFMSFEYPNYGSYKTAYTIIDKENIEKIRNSIATYNMAWSANHDTENKQVNLEETLRQVEIFKEAGVLKEVADGKVPDKSWIIKSKFRTGGYINQGSRKGKLQHFLLDVNGDTTKHYIHHRGHTFDNRKEFLSDVEMEKHDDIHKVQEPTQNIYRGKCIMIGDFYDTELDCSCNYYKTKTIEPECDNYCEGTLLINNIDSLKNFIDIIKSSKYKNLPR
jgi:hypothetical protein